MSPWGWSPQRNRGIWRYGAGWVRPILSATPYLTIGLLLLMLFFLGGTLTASKGVLFGLPEGNFTDTENVGHVLLLMPMQHEIIVFYDDTRYILGDSVSMRRLAEDLSESVERSARKSLLVLADRRVDAGSLMELMAFVRKCGVEKILFAGKRTGGGE